MLEEPNDDHIQLNINSGRQRQTVGSQQYSRRQLFSPKTPSMKDQSFKEHYLANQRKVYLTKMQKEFNQGYFDAKRNQVQDIRRVCIAEMNKDEVPYEKKYYYDIFMEDVRQGIHDQIVERMQRMDFMNKPEAMKYLFNVQEEEHILRKREARDVYLEFKQGLQDPSREAAQFEKLRVVEKCVGKKKKRKQFDKKIQHQTNYKLLSLIRQEGIEEVKVTNNEF